MLKILKDLALAMLNATLLLIVLALFLALRLTDKMEHLAGGVAAARALAPRRRDAARARARRREARAVEQGLIVGTLGLRDDRRHDRRHPDRRRLPRGRATAARGEHQRPRKPPVHGPM